MLIAETEYALAYQNSREIHMLDVDLNVFWTPTVLVTEHACKESVKILVQERALQMHFAQL